MSSRYLEKKTTDHLARSNAKLPLCGQPKGNVVELLIDKCIVPLLKGDNRAQTSEEVYPVLQA